MNIQKYLKQRKQLIDRALDRYLPPVKSSTAARAMRYSIFAGGKRFRPVLCLAACEAVGPVPCASLRYRVGGDTSSAMPTAAALEMIHTYSLIHDDLPCMDDDAFRRGKPTSHKVFGEAMAILSGDALCALAFEVVSKYTDKKISAGNIVSVIKELSSAMGQAGMVGGQVTDLESEDKKISLNKLKSMHAQKTGALIKAAIKCGAILGGGSPAEVYALSKYAQHLGMSFQIIDDILDVEGNLSDLGKTPGSDQRKQKATYPKILGVARSRALALQHSRLALKAISRFGKRAEPLREILNLYAKRKG